MFGTAVILAAGSPCIAQTASIHRVGAESAIPSAAFQLVVDSNKLRKVPSFTDQKGLAGKMIQGPMPQGGGGVTGGNFGGGGSGGGSGIGRMPQTGTGSMGPSGGFPGAPKPPITGFPKGKG